ncbi:MAG: winged helix-turn-helix domain-containing protein [Alphaproteobacteria bacterium]|nr:winged helix-turn-helix domain-containing protein [Alphaproteobacteria bacterium]
MSRIPQAERQATVSVILKYDLLRHVKFCEIVEAGLPDTPRGKSGRSKKQSLWDILSSLLEDYMTARTTLISDLHVQTGLAKPTVTRRVQELVSMDVIAIETDPPDRRCRIV